MSTNRKTNLEVNLNNLKYNYDFYKDKTNKQIFSIVKANAYGLGAIEVSKYLISLGSNYLGVATLEEALELRDNGITSPILVMGYVAIENAQLAFENNITLTVISLSWAKELFESSVSGLNLHIKINSSMNRLGHDNFEETSKSLNLLKVKHNVEGIFTHYCCTDKVTVSKDFIKFKKIVNKLNYNFKWIHAANSYNALEFKEDFTNAIRVGIGLYGGLKNFGLKNVAQLKSEVVMIREVMPNEIISYDGLYKVEHKLKVAILTIGYADGLRRSDSGNSVFINNNKYPIIGNICMDQMMIAVDDKVSLYDEVEIFGNNIDISDIADSRNTIDYEVLTSVSSRVYRKYIK